MNSELENASTAVADTASLSSSSSSSSGHYSPVLEPIKTAETRRSIATVPDPDPDPYDALEHALTPDQETPAEREARLPITYTRTGTSVTSVASRPPDFEVVWEENDAEHPRNWPLWYRAWIIVAVSYSGWVVVLYSTAYTASTPGLMREFGASKTIVTLGLTTYLLGLAVGSLVFAPLSELYGRRIVYLVGLAIWALLIIPCGVATSLSEIIIVRFFGYVVLVCLLANSCNFL